MTGGVVVTTSYLTVHLVSVILTVKNHVVEVQVVGKESVVTVNLIVCVLIV